MTSTTERLEFGPPREAASPRSFALALIVHALLIAALTWGVSWKSTDKAATFEAELWSGVPQQAAPRLVEPLPPQPPAPAPEPTPAPPPRPPAPRPAPAPAPPQVKVTPPAPDVDIALQQEKKRKLLQQQKEDAAEKAEKAQKLQDKRKAELLAKKDLEKEKERENEKAQKVRDDLAKRKAADDAKKLEAKKQEAAAQAKEKQAAVEASAQKQRQENMKRIAGLAGATGGADAKGSAQKSSGPSANYTGRLAALFKRNISFSNADSIQGNPKAVIQVKVSSTGLIMSSKLIKSSGVPAWDEAALRAVEKAERIPLDENGKVVPEFPVEFGPKD
jgi:colicin import membrane protein